MTEFSSTSITNLAKALLKAQEQIGPVTKDSTNPFLKNRYASLAAVLEAVRHPLLDNGILLIQRPVESEPGTVAVETRLLHISGEWLAGTMTIALPEVEPGSKLNMGQALGASFTYAKRYSLMALLGIAATEEDTDNEVRQPQQQHQPRFQPTQHPQQKQEQPLPELPSSGVTKPSYPGLPDISGVSYEEAKDLDGTPIVIARGATLQNKESLKRVGFRWSPERRAWWVAA